MHQVTCSEVGTQNISSVLPIQAECPDDKKEKFASIIEQELGDHPAKGTGKAFFAPSTGRLGEYNEVQRTKAMLVHLKSRLSNKDVKRIEECHRNINYHWSMITGKGGGGDLFIKSFMTAVIKTASCEPLEEFIGDKWPFMQHKAWNTYGFSVENKVVATLDKHVMQTDADAQPMLLPGPCPTCPALLLAPRPPHRHSLTLRQPRCMAQPIILPGPCPTCLALLLSPHTPHRHFWNSLRRRPRILARCMALLMPEPCQLYHL